MNGICKWMACALVLATSAVPALADECEWRDDQHYAEYKRVLATFENEVVLWFCAPCGQRKPERVDVFDRRYLASGVTHNLYVPTVLGAKGARTFQNLALLVQCPADGWPASFTLDPDTLIRSTVFDSSDEAQGDETDALDDLFADGSFAIVQRWTAYQGDGFTFRAPVTPMRKKDPGGRWITWTWTDSSTGVQCDIARVDIGDPAKARQSVDASLAGQSAGATVISETASELALPPVPGKMRVLQFPEASVLVGVYARGPALYIVDMRSRWSVDPGLFKASLQEFRFQAAAPPVRTQPRR